MSNANKNLQEKGICPVCGSEQLSYKTPVFDDYGVKYPYICEECGAKGNEAYHLEFDGHYDIQTKGVFYMELTNETARRILNENKDNTLWFTDGTTFSDMYSMLRNRMQFGEAETLCIIASLKLNGAKIKQR